MNLLKMETTHENNLIYNHHTNTPAGEILNHRFFLHKYRNNKFNLMFTEMQE